MRAITLLVRRDLRKRPGQAVAMLVMALLAGFLANLGLLLGTSYASNLGDQATALNAPEALAIVHDSPATGPVLDRLRADSDVHRVETAPLWTAPVSFPYGTDRTSADLTLYDVDAPVDLGRRTITERLPDPIDNPIWAPAVLQAAGHYDLGDPITFESVSGTVTFRIAAFVEDTYGGTPGFGSLAFGLPAADFAQFEGPGFVRAVQVKIAAANATVASEAWSRAVTGAATDLGQAVPVIWSGNLEIITMATSMSSGIFSAILIAFSALIVVVAAVVIRFLLRNVITVDLASIGVLRATGFTSGTIVTALTATFAVCTLVASAAGAGLSYAVLPLLRDTLRAQSGMSWDPGFSWPVFAATVGGLVAMVALISAASAVRIRRISTISALAGGLTTHSFRAAPLPLATSRGPLTVLLGLKTALGQAGQTAVIAVTVAIVTFAAVFSFGMSGTLLGDRDQAVQMLAGEVEDVTVLASPGADVPALVSGVRELPGVERAFTSSVVPISSEGSMIMFQITDDPSQWRYDPVYEGRLPRHANEIALGARTADLEGVGVGDLWTTDIGPGPQEFLVTGVATGARNMGRFAMLTTGAFQRLDPAFTHHQIVAYAADPATVVSEIRARFAADIDTVNDTHSSINVELSGYLAAVPATATTILVFTCIVVALVVGLVVTTMLVQSRRELGIQKATGFTHRQLTGQTLWTYVPPVALGALAGAAVAVPTTAPLLGALLRSIGVLKVNIATSPVPAVAIPLAVIVLAAAITWVSARRIKEVSAQALVSE